MEQFLLEKGYEILQLLGRGRFGAVYLVRHKPTGGLYACKTASDEKDRILLRREAGHQREISHPLYAAFEELLESEDATFLVMEYVAGDNLAVARRREGIANADAEGLALSVGIALGEGLRYLHNLPEPLLYRDLKPQDVIIAPGGIKLLDLGCVCALREASKSIAGTKGYAAPEQLGMNMNLQAGVGRQTGADLQMGADPQAYARQQAEVELRAGVGRQMGARQGKYSDIYGLGQILYFIYGNLEPGSDMKKILSLCTEEDPGKRLPDMWLVLHMLSALKALRAADAADAGGTAAGRTAVARADAAGTAAGRTATAGALWAAGKCKSPGVKWTFNSQSLAFEGFFYQWHQ